MSRRVRARQNVVGEVLDGEAVLLDLDTGLYFALNSTATRVWTLLFELGDSDSVVSKLEREVQCPRDQLRADVDALVDELQRRGLVEVEAR